jgi:C1A family cysteine protease
MRRQEEERRKQEEKKRQDEMKKEEMMDRNIPAEITPSIDLVAFNWRDSGLLSKVQYQGICGSCWAFTSAAVYEANYKMKNNKIWIYQNNSFWTAPKINMEMMPEAVTEDGMEESLTISCKMELSLKATCHTKVKKAFALFRKNPITK